MTKLIIPKQKFLASEEQKGINFFSKASTPFIPTPTQNAQGAAASEEQELMKENRAGDTALYSSGQKLFLTIQKQMHLFHHMPNFILISTPVKISTCYPYLVLLAFSPSRIFIEASPILETKSQEKTHLEGTF